MTTLPYSMQGSPDKPVLVMLHGFMGRRYDWTQIQLKLPTTHCYVTLDLPGHGQALFDNESIYTFKHTCDLILGTLDNLGVNTFSLLGYSLGGRVALHLALLAPERVEKLLLISASPGIEDENERQARLLTDQKRGEALRTQQLRVFLNDWYSMPLFQSLREHPSFDAIISDRCLNNSTSHLAKAIVGLSPGMMENLWPQLNALTMPIYYITGEFDKLYTQAGKRIKSILPEMTLKMLPGCGHAVHVEKRYETVAWLLHCMAEH